MPNPELNLKDAQFKDLFDPVWLQQADVRFLQRLADQNPKLYKDLLAYREETHPFSPEEISSILLACAPFVEEFIAQLFNIEHELAISARETLSNQPVFAFKQWYVQRQARRRLL